MIEIKRLTSDSDIATEAARQSSIILKNTLEKRDIATFVLAGGRLPQVAYRILLDSYKSTFDWSSILFLIGDERCVPLNDSQSSWLSAALPMFKAHPEIPADHKLRPPSQLPAEQAADSYEKTLQALPYQKNGVPIFDLIWIGIGEDGHTLSLFPNHPDNIRTNHLVIPIHNAPKPPPDRITFSEHALSGVRHAVAFINGESKADVVSQIAAGDHSFPIVQASQNIESHGGHVTWLVDNAAMANVSGKLRLS